MSSSSTAGPSSAPPGPSNTYTPPPAHPAFPSLIPRALIPQPAFNPQRDNPPSTPDALWAFLQKHTSHHDIIDNVIPALLYMVSPRKADGEKKPWGESREDESSESTSKGRGKGKGRGRGKGDGVEKAEKTICLPALDMTVMGDDALARNAGPMMFILYVHASRFDSWSARSQCTSYEPRRCQSSMKHNPVAMVRAERDISEQQYRPLAIRRPQPLPSLLDRYCRTPDRSG